MLRPFLAFLRSCLLGVLLCAAGLARAQSARWEPASGTLARDQVSQLNLVFQDAEPKETPVPPKVPGLDFEGNPGRSEQSTFNVTFGSQAVRQHTVIYSYRVRPTRADGEVRLPAFTVQTDAGPLTVPAAGFTIAAATVGQSGLPLDKIASARFTPPASPIWAGEVFRLTHTIDVARRYATNNILASALEWTSTPLVAEDWSKPAGAEALVNGESRLLVTNETRAIAPSATASLAIPPATQLINLPTGQSQFGIFNQPTFEQFTLTSAPATLQIRPLPSPAPKDFQGAVGQFTLTGKIVPQKAVVGEPITWTLTLEGTGNWPLIDSLPPRELSRDFRVVSPRAQKTPKPESLFDASLSEDLVLIPQKPGRTILGPYTLSVFNPSTGAYETLRTEPVTVEISAPPGGGVNLQPTPNSVGAPSTTTTPPSGPQTSGFSAPPVLPPSTPLPADPLPAGPTATAPLGNWPRALLPTLTALLAPLLLWLALAARHARRHDPLRSRREAHSRLQRIIADLEIAAGSAPGVSNPDHPSAEAQPSSALLLDWQHATRALLALESATPSARDLPDPLWAALWIETERALYRPTTTLAADWFSQARDALARATPPAHSVLAALRPAHLFPRVALWALALLLALNLTPSGSAAEARDAYTAGDFPAAEKAWREAVSAAPLAWPARHNLALSLAQQGKWDEAAGHAYVASLQAPRSAEARLLLDVTLAKASFRPPHTPAPALLLSPLGWQRLALVAALVLFTLVPAAHLLAKYLPTSRARLPLVVRNSFFLLSIAALLGAILALRAHGPMIHPDAVLVWRAATLRAVPTDAGDQKVTSALAPGTLARVDKSFLGWRRLVLADGTTGWVRAEPLAGLWRTP